MPKHVFLVRTGPSSPDRTDEYNDWYDNVHLPDLLDVKGVVGASRYRVAKAQQGGAPVEGPQYLAIYEVEIEDVQDFFDDMMRAATDGSMRMSDVLDQSVVDLSMWEEITPRVS
jgi:hypothetical protein